MSNTLDEIKKALGGDPKALKVIEEIRNQNGGNKVQKDETKTLDTLLEEAKELLKELEKNN